MICLLHSFINLTLLIPILFNTRVQTSKNFIQIFLVITTFFPFACNSQTAAFFLLQQICAYVAQDVYK